MTKLKRLLKRKKKTGFSLIEILVVTAVIGILTISSMWGLNQSWAKGRDAQRKSDLNKIKVAFEDYYNDHACYPPTETLDNCQSSDLRPYLSQVPCDPKTKQPYLYRPVAGDTCSGYRVYTSLENTKDTAIAELNCDTPAGCGVGLEYNYGISAGVSVYDSAGVIVAEPTPTPTPTPTGPIYVFACDASGACNRYELGHPALVNCPVTFPQSNCQNLCGDPSVRCSQ